MTAKAGRALALSDMWNTNAVGYLGADLRPGTAGLVVAVAERAGTYIGCWLVARDLNDQTDVSPYLTEPLETALPRLLDLARERNWPRVVGIDWHTW